MSYPWPSNEAGLWSYAEAAQLTKILAIAITKLGGKLEIPMVALAGTPASEFVISTSEDLLRDTMTIKVRAVRREWGEVLDVSQLEKAEFVGTRGGQAKTWIARANDESATITTEDLEAEFYVSPILTMRTIGVALVDSSGAMVNHTTRNQ